MQFERQHEFAGSAERVATIMSDPSFHIGLELPDLSRPEVVAHDVDGASHRLTLRYRYVGQLDPVARRVVGARAITWVQDLRIDVSTGTGALGFSADGVGGRADGTATVSFAPIGSGASRRTIRGDFRIRVPLLGAKAERAIVPGLERRLDVEAAALAVELAR